MEKLPEHITEDLLAKYFAKEMSIDENTAIEKWRNDAIENDELLQQYEMLWLDLGVNFKPSEHTTEDIDVNLAWENLKQKKADTELQVGVSPLTWIKIAASIVLVLGLFALINQLDKEEFLLAEASTTTLSIQLSDGSEVTLNKNSKLSYPEKFQDKTRPVELGGEAFFDIAKNSEKPFIIKIGEATVTVLGTSFNIKSSEKFDTVTVSVNTGKVRFTYKDQKQELEAGEKATLFASVEKIQMINENTMGLDQFWRTRKLTFSGESLQEIVNTLSLAYEKSIELVGEDFSGCSLNADFENDTLENVLQVIALTLNLSIHEEGESISLRGEGCVPK